MTRSERLLHLLQTIRQFDPPVTAATLAREMGVSTRSIYRDIETLRSMGVVIDGEAGFGYILVDDWALPPVKFTEDELDALVLGLRKVMATSNQAAAAKSALAKLRFSLPPAARRQIEDEVVTSKSFAERPATTVDTRLLRKSAREERKLKLNYVDQTGQTSQRIVWPLSLASIDFCDLLIAWCELRQDHRTFRLDRILDVQKTSNFFRPHRKAKLREFYECNHIRPQSKIEVNPNG